MSVNIQGNFFQNYLFQPSSKVSRFKVLLIERGGNSGNFFTEIPFVASLIGYDDRLVKTFPSVKQKHACRSSDGLCILYAGAGLGGGSTHNGLAWVRGSSIDFDNWENVYGATGWSYKDVLPHFKSIETYLNASLASDGILGDQPNGIKISTPNSYPNYSSILLNALAGAGYNLGNYNGLDSAQFSVYQVTIGQETRSSSWNVFLKPAIKRTNLDVISFASVTKINFDGNKRAVSVSYTKNGLEREVKVSKEVILSAGAVDSAKLLLLSGIGDKKELVSVGVSPIVANLPSVGKSFQDQPEILLNLTAHADLKKVTYKDFENYQKRKSGLLIKNVNLVIGFLKDGISSMNENDTRIEYEFDLDDGLKSTQNPGQIFVTIALIAPSSRGSIKLKSADPRDDPFIDPNYLSTKSDINLYRRGIKRFVKFSSQSEIFKNLGIEIRSTDIPGCGRLTPMTLMNDTFLDCFIRMESETAIHMASSCRMGSPNDPLAVVDPRLRVLGGVKNVRVIDASIMPQVTRGNTNAPTVMIADKGSKMVIEDNS